MIRNRLTSPGQLDLRDADTRKAILDIAAASEFPEVTAFVGVVIEDYIKHGDFLVADANEVISLAVDVVGARDVKGLERQDNLLIAGDGLWRDVVLPSRKEE